MRENGEVIKATHRSVTVRMKRTSACAQCHACQMSTDEKEMLINAENECGAGIGDFVQVELKPEAFLSAALILYGLPFIGLTLGFTLGYFAGKQLGMGEYASLAAFLCGLLLAWLAYAAIKKREPRWRSKGYTPVASAVVSSHQTRS